MKFPERILSLAPSATEILYSLGLGDKIVAVTRFCDYPEDAKTKPKVGGWLDVREDLVKTHNPDLIITSSFVQDKIVVKYRKMGLQVLHSDPVTLEDVYVSIIDIGKSVGKREAAERIVADMEKSAAAINEQVRLFPRKRVYCEEWHKPPTVSGNWVPDLIKLAGGTSLIDSGSHSREITLQEIQRFNPEIIIISLCGFGDKIDKKIITERIGWEKLDAVRKDKIFVFDDSLLNRPDPRLIEGLKEIVKTIHYK